MGEKENMLSKQYSVEGPLPLSEPDTPPEIHSKPKWPLTG